MFFKKCLFPKKIYRSFNYLTGKSQLIWSQIDYNLFSSTKGPFDTKLIPIQLPCGVCIKCQNKKSNEWVLRNSLEAQDYYSKCFVTLTYSDENLKDVNGNTTLDKSYSSLHKRDYQLFIKRLRAANPNSKIKYFLSGEYGKIHNTWRPHYHFILYGWQPKDLVPSYNTQGSTATYTSYSLERLWGLGKVNVGIHINPKTIRYITKYLQKMQSFKPGALKPFVAMSLGRNKGHGIAGRWLLKNYKEIYENGFIWYDGKKFPIPRYFDKMVEELGLLDIVNVKIARYEKPFQVTTDGQDLQQLRQYIYYTEQQWFPSAHIMPLFKRVLKLNKNLSNGDLYSSFLAWYNKFKLKLFSEKGVPWDEKEYSFL